MSIFRLNRDDVGFAVEMPSGVVMSVNFHLSSRRSPDNRSWVAPYADVAFIDTMTNSFMFQDQLPPQVQQIARRFGHFTMNEVERMEAREIGLYMAAFASR